MGDTTLRILIFIGILFATFLVATIFKKIIHYRIKKGSTALGNDPTNYAFLRHMGVALIYTVGFGLAVYTVPSLRTLSKTMLGGAGILAVAIGFASQAALSNVISGLFIIIFRPFRLNDRLNIQTYKGIVEDITLRHTVLRDFENKRIVIPNSVISNEIIVNADFAEEMICRWIDVGISYESDIDLSKSIMADEVQKHPLHVDPRKEEQILEGIPEVIVRVVQLADSSVNLRAWAWAKDTPDGFILACDLLESIKKRFDREGVVIPFPHSTVYVKEFPNTRPQ